MHKLKTLKIWAQYWSSKLQENNERQNTPVNQNVTLSDAYKRLQIMKLPLSQNYVISEGTVYNVLYYQQP